MNRVITNIQFESENLQRLNEVVLQDNFQTRVSEVRKTNITITQKPTSFEVNFPNISAGDHLIEPIEEIGGRELDPAAGEEFSKKVAFAGYDESKYRFLALEGEAHITSHTLTYHLHNSFIPISKITFYFYTKSQNIERNSKYIKLTEDVTSESNFDYVIDRNQLIEEYSLENSILFIDGPIIGGNITSYTLQLVESLHSKNILPIFFVKNSDSDLVINSNPLFKNEYNSDLHWAYSLLKKGQRSSLFKYSDSYNKNNSKIFYYFKPFSYTTPQRIEFHPETYVLYKEYFPKIFDLIYYLLLVHGDKSNPQIRPIAVSEKYSREIIRMVNIDLLLKNSSLIQTMDQSRFGG
ncbi:MAG: hypothetical protein GYA14_01255 [Ignavibacteria bacterium]|nr:hypothetical protein [Ignavibacteria bacterium]